MKRFIIFLLLATFSMAGMPSDSQAGYLADRDKDRDNSKNSAMRMKPNKLSKQTAKLRKQREKDRKKQMADIKRSNQQRNRSKN